MDIEAKQLLPGQELGPYRVIRALGAGGMGAVYEVEHVALGVRYALKTFILQNSHADFFRQRFLAEGRILARLNHPNLVRVFDLAIDESSGLAYYVMDLVLYKDGEARTLSDIEEGGADEEHLSEWFLELLDALSYVHANGIVHRDIKLGNILLAPGRHVVLSDFGISKVVGDGLRTDIGMSRTVASVGSTGTFIMGTEGFMAPEILRGREATPASDVFSLGVVFFKLLTGVWYDPCLAPKADSQTTTSINSVKLLAHLEMNWDEILPRMLEEDPDKRETDLAVLAASLRRKPVDDVDAQRFRPTLRRLAAAAAALALAAAAVAAAMYFRGSGGLRGESPDAELADAFAAPESMR